MDLQFRFGIAGVALGLFIGIIGSIAVAHNFGDVLLRIILCPLFGGVLSFAVYFVIKTFLPELLSTTNSVGETVPLDLDSDSGGHSVNITLPEENFVGSDNFSESGDQAQALRHEYAVHREKSDEMDGDTGLIAEVSEGRHSPGMAGEFGADHTFNEDAFYQGVEHLPDIGGFSEQFQEHDTDGTIVGEEGTPMVSGLAAGKRPSTGKKGNMDPELIAKAIQTALKKDDL